MSYNDHIKLFSSDLNGTLVHQHTMSDMIRLYVGREQFIKASSVFEQQTKGTATIEETFQIVAPLTRGLTLRQAIEYTMYHIQYIDGFNEFVDYLHSKNIPLVINSTGYSVTIYAIREQIGHDKIHGYIGNSLRFGLDGDPKMTLCEYELEQKVETYFKDPSAMHDKSYDLIKATGVVDLGINDENAKATKIIEYAEKYFPEIVPAKIVHIGDTMGDSAGIAEIAKLGGIGIAFNYNTALEQFLLDKISSDAIKDKIYMIDKKGGKSSLINVLNAVFGDCSLYNK